jgi:regulator of protease activity HflC (stomatin/prohibitin superfamily)
MGYFISIAILAVVAFVVLAVISSGAVTFTDPRTRERVTYRRGPALLTVLVVVVLLAGVTVLASYKQIEAGDVGVVRTFGEITGQVEEGPNFIAPWKTVQTFNIKVQRAQFGSTLESGVGATLGRIEAASIDTQDVFLNITVNWRVSGTAIQDLVRNVGTDYFDILVPTRVLQHTKAEVVKHTAVEATQKREEIREAIERSLQLDLDQFSITVVSIQLDNISYQPAFSQAIEDKQVATQNALRAGELVAQREAEARQAVAAAAGEADAAIEIARGEAERNRVEAAGEADAIRLRGDAVADANTAIAGSLTSDLIQFEALKQLDGVQIALLPADGNFLLDPTAILRRNDVIDP